LSNKGLISDLVSIVGLQNATDDIFYRINYGQDALALDLEKEKIPAAVVRPASAEEVSEVMRYANQNKIPVYIHGKGTAFKGSAKPKREGSIILSTEKLTTFEMHEEDMYFEAGAGVIQLDLQEELLKHGYMLQANIGSKYSATIGGAVAINTIGHMVDFCMGKLIDHVLGLEVVLPTGEIIETGTRSIRRPAGIDYTRFFAGCEGLFGIITKVRMRLVPSPKRAYVLAFFKELKDIARAFIKVYHEKLPPPLYGELLEEETAKAPFRLRGLGKPKGSMALAITIGYTQEYADWQAREIVRIFKTEGAIEARVITSEKEHEQFWMCRENIMNILAVEEGEEKLVLGGAAECPVPLHNLPDLIDYYRGGHNHDILKEGKLLLYGHVGTADLHAMWGVPESWPQEKKMQSIREATELEKEVYVKWGCAPGEIGQTASRVPFLRERYGEDAYRMLKNVKRAIDPNNILNPGNLEGE